MLMPHWGLGFSWDWRMMDEVLLCETVVSDNSFFQLLLEKKNETKKQTQKIHITPNNVCHGCHCQAMWFPLRAETRAVRDNSDFRGYTQAPPLRSVAGLLTYESCPMDKSAQL